MSSTYVTDGTLTVSIVPNGGRRGDGWCLQPNWTQHGEWVANKRDAVGAAHELLKTRKAHVAAIRRRAEAVLKAAGLSCEPLLDALTEEFSK